MGKDKIQLHKETYPKGKGTIIFIVTAKNIVKINTNILEYSIPIYFSYLHFTTYLAKISIELKKIRQISKAGPA